MTKFISAVIFSTALSLICLSVGCGGTAENTVSAPPSAEQTAAEEKAMKDEYAKQEAEMKKRDQQFNN